MTLAAQSRGRSSARIQGVRCVTRLTGAPRWNVVTGRLHHESIKFDGGRRAESRSRIARARPIQYRLPPILAAAVRGVAGLVPYRKINRTAPASPSVTKRRPQASYTSSTRVVSAGAMLHPPSTDNGVPSADAVLRVPMVLPTLHRHCWKGLVEPDLNRLPTVIMVEAEADRSTICGRGTFHSE